MATKTAVCPECATRLVRGRYSCEACGALVASVATATRPFFPPERAVPPTDAPSDPSSIEPDAYPSPNGREPDDEPLASWANPVVDDDALDDPEATAAGEQERDFNGLIVARPETATWPALASQDGSPTWPEAPVWPPVRTFEESPARSFGQPLVRTVDESARSFGQPLARPVEEPADPSTIRVPAGAILPPSAVLPPGEALPIAKGARHAAADGSDKPTADVALRAAIRDVLADLPPDAPRQIIATGAGIAALGMLLPWSGVVIGSSGMGGYFDQWGLAAPGHLLVLTLLLVVAALPFAADRLPATLRLGMPAIGLGFLVLGLCWPYLFSQIGASIGVYVVAAGTLVMIAGAVLDGVSPRHATDDETV